MKILMLTDSLFLPTGYSNQSRQLAEYLHNKGHEIHILMNAYNGGTIKYAELKDGTKFPYTMYGEMTQTYFRNTISKYCKEIKPDIFFILLDTFMLHGGDGWFLNVDCSPAKTIFWYPSDGGGGMPLGCERILKKVECPVAMAEFGQKQVKDYYNIDAKHIPHGLDINRFYRLPDDQRTDLRKKWNLDDKFVIGVVARNQPRKNLDRTIKAMRLIADKIPDAVLLLHLDPNDAANGIFHLPSLIKKYNLENRVRFTGMEAHKGFDWSEMNNVYNLMDCFLLTTSGEGFGIPIVEAMACEVPVVATDYTSTPELVINNGAGLGIKLSGTEQVNMFQTNMQEYDKEMLNGTLTGSWEVERGLCSITDCTDKVEFIYNHPGLAKQMGLSGRKAVLEKYDFKIIGDKFEKLMESLK